MVINFKNIFFSVSLALNIVFISMLSVSAIAQEISGEFPDGSVQVGFDNQTCNSSGEGSIRYNSAEGLEYCDGSSWVSACP